MLFFALLPLPPLLPLLPLHECVSTLPNEKYLKHYQHCANRDGRIGHIESRPGMKDAQGNESQPNFQKIGDGAMENTVRNVAGGAAEEQRETRRLQNSSAAAGHQQPRDEPDDD